MEMDVAVVGAGMGGLAAAAILAHRGADVTVFEAGPRPGGKVGVAEYEGVQFDTGPSLLTLPGILDEVFNEAGTALREHLNVVRLNTEFRYHFPDGTSIDIKRRERSTMRSVLKAIDHDAVDELRAFLDYAKDIWDVAGPSFIFSEAPTWRTFAEMGWSALTSLRSIDPFETMESAIASRVENEKLRHILRRFATYVGSDPRQAPATLNCIAWLEIGGGGYGVEGGMHEIAKALARLARDRGAEFHFEEPVRNLEMEGNRVTGVQTDDDRMSADLVVSNADVSHLNDSLLPKDKHDRAPNVAEELSMSGWTAVVKARRLSYVDRPAHQVLFPEDYEQEFIDIFQRNRPPSDPAVYLCAQEKAHDRSGWQHHEPIFMMANAPPEPEAGPRDPDVWQRLADTMLDRAVEAELLHPDDEIVWERTPADLARRYPGTRGAIYGASSNSPMAAFNRPANEPHRIDDLLLCGGSVHPGGGVPLCLQSGRLAANIALGERPPDLFPQ